MTIWNPALPPPIDPQKLAAEIAELEGYRALALKIGNNAKGNALVAALPQALDQIERNGGLRKAVIFTDLSAHRAIWRLFSNRTATRAKSCFSTAQTAIPLAGKSTATGWTATETPMLYQARKRPT